jgi:adenylyl-sulfate kinase
MMVREKWWRHLLKTGTWRVIAITFLMVLSYHLTGSLVVAGSIAVIDLVVKSALYFAHEYAWAHTKIGKEMVEKKGHVVWFTGLSGSGKTTLADAVAVKLRRDFTPTARLDGDIARRTFSSDLGFSSEDRAENCKRATHVASYLKENHIVLASFISPKKSMRQYARELCGDDITIIHVDCPIEVCAERDPKGMYAKLENGRFMGQPFTGCHPCAPYERPVSQDDCSLGLPDADFRIDTSKASLEDCVDTVVAMLALEGRI